VAAWPLVLLGVLVWGLGVVFESVGDAQLAAYKRDPDRGPILDRGLWAWTRHPNYFGDACVWWGIWLAGGAASGWLPALLTVVSPLAMTHFIRNVTGAKLLERTMSTRPGWDEYAARVPLFFPRPPHRR
jgi:steroid 5-alpha reductase family enzyme